MIAIRIASAAGLALFLSLALQDEGRLLDGRLHHLGDDVVKEWTETTPRPEGKSLALEFDAKAGRGESTLVLRQRDIDELWTVKINGREIGRLIVQKEARTTHLPIAAGVLRDGKNELTVASERPQDDVVVGDFRLHDRALRDILKLGKIAVTVKDGGKPLPARVSVADPAGALVELYYAADRDTAARRGTFYTRGDGASFEAPEGKYVLYATRGMEWSLGKIDVEVRYGKTTPADFALSREVDTKGFVAADTHIHTLTFSGHGDASMEERMITLAGEGVELAVATDHNHNTDYAPLQRSMKLAPWFTPVTGNEVSTDNGHFNAFPLHPKDPVPVHKESDWVKLVQGMRDRGAKVVILNHPHWPDLKKGPFGVFGLDPHTGDRAPEGKFTFDAMELVNSCTDEKEPLSILADWMALLNRGERLTGVGSSDSHTVWDPVGQGRTYVRSKTDDPARIDVEEACEAFVRGDVTVSLGIFVDVVVNGSRRMGETVKAKDGRIVADLRVAAPAWTRPRKALLFVNGVKAEEKPVPVEDGKPTDARIAFSVAAPPHDAHVVCAVLGDPVRMPGWTTLNDYTMAVTNPVFVDADKESGYTPPRETARRLLRKSGAEALRDADAAIRAQMISILREEAPDVLRAAAAKDPSLEKLLTRPAEHRH